MLCIHNYHLLAFFYKAPKQDEAISVNVDKDWACPDGLPTWDCEHNLYIQTMIDCCISLTSEDLQTESWSMSFQSHG